MNCDAIARHYRWMEFAVFGRTIERCRFHFLPELRSARRALVLGDGDGRFLQQLLNNCPCVHADYIDRSAKMLALARRRAGENRVAYHHADALTDELPRGNYDLIAAHFFFDCFERPDLERVVRRIAESAPHARWVVSEFRVPPGPLAIPSRLLLWIMYRFFGTTTKLKTRRLVDHRPFMKAAGFRLEMEERRAGGLLVSELWTPEP